jgi:hypothetical protein
MTSALDVCRAAVARAVARPEFSDAAGAAGMAMVADAIAATKTMGRNCNGALRYSCPPTFASTT